MVALGSNLRTAVGTKKTSVARRVTHRFRPTRKKGAEGAALRSWSALALRNPPLGV